MDVSKFIHVLSLHNDIDGIILLVSEMHAENVVNRCLWVNRRAFFKLSPSIYRAILKRSNSIWIFNEPRPWQGLCQPLRLIFQISFFVNLITFIGGKSILLLPPSLINFARKLPSFNWIHYFQTALCAQSITLWYLFKVQCDLPQKNNLEFWISDSLCWL